ncbi:MAG TPA: ABC transporter permease subunit [Candidatus Tectomicrobia bacterium]|nr:ABC transporter permease subunit [Candidatus Tectomicrobia bacterium]
MVLALRAASAVAFLLLWEWAARVPVSFNFPSPAATIAALVALVRSGAILAATLTSLQSLLLGFGAAVLIGVPLGLVMGVVRPVGRVARVYLDLLIALPTAALIPLVILTFGISVLSSAVIVFVFSAPFVTMNAYGGVRDVRPRLVEMARAFGASWLQLFTRIVLPSAMPMVLAGIRYALSRAFVGLIIAELLLSPFGLGRLIMTSRSMFEHDRMFATVLWTLLLAGAALAGLARLEAHLLRWRT